MQSFLIGGSPQRLKPESAERGLRCGSKPHFFKASERFAMAFVRTMQEGK